MFPHFMSTQCLDCRDKVCVVRRQGKKKSGVQPKNYEEWVQNLRPDQRLNEDQDLFLKDFGKAFPQNCNVMLTTLSGLIVPDDPESGHFLLEPIGCHPPEDNQGRRLDQ